MYSVQSQELQLPIVRVLMNQLQSAGMIPDLPKEAVEPTVSTGLEALGRGQDLEKLTQAVNMMTGLQPLQQDPDINLPTLKLRLLNALGIDTAGLLLTQDEKMQRIAEQSAQGAVVNGASAAGANMGAAVGQGAGEDMAQA
ncbi:hypothetical protein HKCKGNNM_00049 [Salmonella phage STP-SP6]|nr:hypothetical protein HKCKGNNM_00049 [Salmonella phage STP-SP6]